MYYKKKYIDAYTLYLYKYIYIYIVYIYFYIYITSHKALWDRQRQRQLPTNPFFGPGPRLWVPFNSHTSTDSLRVSG